MVTIDGGVEPEVALRREVLEEAGAQIESVAQILIIQDPHGNGIAIQHVFLATLAPVGLVDLTGTELGIPGRGSYELVRVQFTAEGIAENDLKPTFLADYLSSTCDALLASLRCAVVNAAARPDSSTQICPLITEC